MSVQRRQPAAVVEREIAGRGFVYDRDPNVVPLNPGFFRLLRINQARRVERQSNGENRE